VLRTVLAAPLETAKPLGPTLILRFVDKRGRRGTFSLIALMSGSLISCEGEETLLEDLLRVDMLDCLILPGVFKCLGVIGANFSSFTVSRELETT
jgi:hypothetical protein